MNTPTIAIEIDVEKGLKNVKALDDAMKSLARSTNHVPVTRIEWLAIAFVASQTIGNLALLGIAIALLRGH